MMSRPRALIFGGCVLAVAPPAFAQEVETETARTLPQGVLKAGGGFEYQVSSDGTEAALPLIIEGGLDRPPRARCRAGRVHAHPPKGRGKRDRRR